MLCLPSSFILTAGLPRGDVRSDAAEMAKMRQAKSVFLYTLLVYALLAHLGGMGAF